MLKSLDPVRTSVARQLILRLILAGSLFAVLATAGAVLFGYRSEIHKIDDVFTQIEEGYLGSVVETVWLEDRDRLALLVMGIGRLPNVAYVEMRDPLGSLLSSAGNAAEQADISRTFPLAKEYKGKPVPIGSLMVAASTAPIRQKAIENGWLFALSNLLLVLAASAFLYVMVVRLIARPLGKLAVSARNLGKGHEDQAFLADLEMQNAQNEFGVLVRTLADMQTELVTVLNELRSSETRYRELFANSPIALWEEDFSHVKRRLDAAKEDTDDLEAYFETYPDFVMECAAMVRIIDINDAALRMHGATSKVELLGSLARIFTPASLHGFKNELLAMWHGEGELVFESEVKTLTGEVRDVVIHWQVPPTSRERLDRVIVSQEDVTERVEARHSLAVTVERLMQSNSELERFTHAAAHDLAEPVRNIVSFSQLLERHLQNSGDKEIMEYLGFLVAGAKRMQAQVQGLQDYVRVGEGIENRQMVDLNVLVGRAVDLLSEPIRLSQAEIDAQPLPKVYANGEQIADVFRNLIDNSIKFRRPGLPPRIRFAAEPRQGEWVITVEDNGIGIDPRYASDVFQIFRRLNPPSHATGEGIGLSLCKRVVERHGGRMWVESNLGQGAIFHFSLPSSEEAAASPNGGKAPKSLPASR